MWVVGAMLAVALTGCGSAPVEEEQAPVAVTIRAADSLNPTPAGQSQRLDVLIFQLRSPAAFREAQLTDLYPSLDDARSALGPDLVGVQKLQIAPGDEQSVELELAEGTVQVGVVGAFEQFGQARWRDDIDVREANPSGKTLADGGGLLIYLEALRVELSIE